MSLFITFLQQNSIEEKIKIAPDNAYQIGVFIGSVLPFVILIFLAYIIYRYNKNKIDKE